MDHKNTLGLNNIPQKKVLYSLEETLQNCPTCKDKKVKLFEACEKCRIINTALQRYADSNIPVKYWKIEIDKEFYGDAVLLNKYHEIIKDIKQTYKDGVCLCFAGSHGLGKTTISASILKRVVEKGYSGLYVTLNDIITALISSPETKAEARQKFLTVDFLVIDEFDPRYIGSDNQSDLFGRVLEDIIRIRAQNNLPIIMCTNSIDVTDSFKGPLKTSLKSLMNYVTQIPVLGSDLRKSGK